MELEEEIFKRSEIDYEKLIKYGFKEETNVYIYETFLNNKSFKVIISITKNGKVKGNIIDLDTEEEYNGFRVQKQLGEFASKIKEEYLTILNDILVKCCKSKYFLYEQSNRITSLIQEKYGVSPEFLWKSYPNYGVFRNKKNKKWFGIIMNIDKSKIIKNTKGSIEVLNVKLDDEVEYYLKQKNIYPCYHMSKKNWVSIILDNSLTDAEVMELIEKSYQNIS